MSRSFQLALKVVNIEWTVKLQILGLLQENKAQDIPEIGFSLVSETRQAFPGRWAEGTSITDYPEAACRKLQKN